MVTRAQIDKLDSRIEALVSQNKPPYVPVMNIFRQGEPVPTRDELIAAHLRDHPEDRGADFMVINRIIVSPPARAHNVIPLRTEQ